ncbi:hypothetical protein Maq22A_c00510 [Methylobacterium aquaticum]|uniref:Uncharacterized protein n=1 Tax=Methylobacterium aquaticum TaxID=270351 RepID=A0A0C6FLW3_9HYPH|nr:hypothetical protein Maq22A_c00510 [Methylobacterium aquaticum]
MGAVHRVASSCGRITVRIARRAGSRLRAVTQGAFRIPATLYRGIPPVARGGGGRVAGRSARDQKSPCGGPDNG